LQRDAEAGWRGARRAAILSPSHGPAQLPVDRRAGAESIRFAQPLLDAQSFIERQRLLGHPGTPLLGEPIGCRALFPG
jgi:hypothetical protein